MDGMDDAWLAGSLTGWLTVAKRRKKAEREETVRIAEKIPGFDVPQT